MNNGPFSNENDLFSEDLPFAGLRRDFYETFPVLSDPVFYEVLVKTVLWTGMNLVFHVFFGVLLALLEPRVQGEGASGSSSSTIGPFREGFG